MCSTQKSDDRCPRDDASSEWKKYKLLFLQMSFNKSIIIIYIHSSRLSYTVEKERNE